MKVCPICQSTYEGAVDFCFKDGAPLDLLEEGAGHGQDPETTFDGLGPDEFEPPDAISLSNLPAIDAGELASARSSLGPAEGVVGDPPVRPAERGVSDPFGGGLYDAPDAEASYSDLPPVSGLDRPSALPEEEPTVVGASPVAGRDVERPEARVRGDSGVGEESDRGSTAPKAETGSVRRSASAPARTPRSVEGGAGSNRTAGIVIGILCLGFAVLIVWMLIPGSDGETPVAGPTTTAPAPRPIATAPAPTATAVAAPTPVSVEDETPETAEEDGSTEAAETEGGETPDEGGSDQGAVDDSTPTEATPAPSSRPARVASRRTPTPTPIRDEPPFRVTPAPAPERTPTPTPRPQPTPAPTPTPTVAGAVVSNPWGASIASKGTIAVSTTPKGARVFVDGTAYGSSPVRVELPLGDHTVKVEADGHKPSSRGVKLQTTKVVTVDIVLEATPSAAAVGTLNVVTTPTSAMLYLDGVAKGRTPISVEVTAGVHEFKFQAEGKPPQSISADVRIKTGETKTKVFRLQ